MVSKGQPAQNDDEAGLSELIQEGKDDETSSPFGSSEKKTKEKTDMPQD